MNARKITPGGTGQPGKTGRLFDCALSADSVLDSGSSSRFDGDEANPGRRPRGLTLRVENGSATMRLEVGEPWGGADAKRSFTLTGQGVWLEVGGWSVVRVFVDAVSSDQVVVSWAWTTIAPSWPPRLILVESIDAGVDTPIPEGAREVALSSADPSWLWTTNPGTGDLVINAAQPGAGQPRDVNGARYTAGVDNVACWGLYPL